MGTAAIIAITAVTMAARSAAGASHAAHRDATQTPVQPQEFANTPSQALTATQVTPQPLAPPSESQRDMEQFGILIGFLLLVVACIAAFTPLLHGLEDPRSKAPRRNGIHA